VTAEFLEHQRSIGNDLSTPMPHYRSAGLVPGDRWCVTAVNWLRAHREPCAAPVVLASHERTLDVVSLKVLGEHAVDVPDDLALGTTSPAHSHIHRRRRTCRSPPPNPESGRRRGSPSS
jgi:hypothetical protein